MVDGGKRAMPREDSLSAQGDGGRGRLPSNGTERALDESSDGAAQANRSMERAFYGEGAAGRSDMTIDAADAVRNES